MSIEVPEGWERKNIGNLIGMLPGYAFKSKKFNKPPCEGLPLIRIRDLFTQKPNIFWSEDFNSEYIIKNGDFLIGMDGDFEIEIWRGERALLNQRVLKILSESEELDNQFLFYFMAPWLAKIHLVTSATTVKHLSVKNIRTIEGILPPLPEQKKIAEVLGSVNKVIAATEAVIAQTRRVKQGLLTDLLTQGIGHKKFKQTQIGQIPESWEVVRLETLLAEIDTPMRSGPFGSALKKAELVSAGIPFLGIDNVHKENFVCKFRRFVSLEKFKSLNRYAVHEGDVMITIMGTVGRSCVVPSGVGDALSSKHIWTMSIDQTAYISVLMCWQLNYAPWVLTAFRGEAQGGIMSAINSKVLRGLLLPKPPIEEQYKMAQCLTDINKDIKIEQTKLDQLKRVKKGLMADLLTGKKRVAA